MSDLPQLKYHLLGNSGLRVSELCLGTMTFGEDWGWGAPKEEARKVYDAYRAVGGNFFDTANLYTNGASEEFLGEFAADERDAVVLATKYTNAAEGTDANAGGNHRKSMMTAVEASLRRMKTDYIDLYWMHIWDQITPVEEVMRGFEDLVRQGKVLYVGVSDAPAWWIAQANTIAELRGWSRFVGLQVEYSLTERTVERELLPMARALGLGVTAWSPLAGGVLTGKYRQQQGGDGRYGSEMMAEMMPQDTDAIVDAVIAVAGEVDRSPAQVALAWLRHRPQPVIPIIGARKLDQLHDNLACVSLQLSAEQVSRLDEASAIDMGFPHEFLSREMVRTFVYGGMADRLIL